MEQSKINRINELARKTKDGFSLTEEEKAEQKTLREEYIASFRQSLKSQLDNTVVVDGNGNRRSLKQKELKS